MKKFKIIYLVAVCLLCCLIGVVYAAFMFNQTVNGTAKVGNISTLTKGFVTYAPGYDTENEEFEGLSRADYDSDDEYLAALKARVATPNAINANSVLCYATEKLASSEERSDCFYLNQLGFRFDVAASVDVFVRIHFEDAWILEKTVGGNTLEPQYIRKAQLSSNNYPFKQATNNADWYYDQETNSVYFKHIIDSDAVTEDTDTAGNYIHTFSYDVKSDYFYTQEENAVINGHQAVLVEVSFAIDVVQANRAMAIWQVDPLTIGS